MFSLIYYYYYDLRFRKACEVALSLSLSRTHADTHTHTHTHTQRNRDRNLSKPLHPSIETDVSSVPQVDVMNRKIYLVASMQWILVRIFVLTVTVLTFACVTPVSLSVAELRVLRRMSC